MTVYKAKVYSGRMTMNLHKKYNSTYRAPKRPEHVLSMAF